MRTKPAKICELHNAAMKTAKVPIMYGEREFDRAWAVEAQLFPNANSYVLGGCLVGPDDPAFKRRPACPECRQAEKKWREDNAVEDPLR